MGLNQYFYLGAYLEIYAEPVTRVGPWACPNGHEEGWVQRFCPECGTKMVQTKKTYPALLWDLLPDELDEEMWSPSESHEPPPLLALPNKRKKEPDHYDFDDDIFVVEIEEDIPVMFKNAFEANYADVIAELRKVAKVEVKFGTIGYLG